MWQGIDKYIQNQYNSCMSKTVNISIPEELLKEVDIAAKKQYASRSDYIRETLVHRISGKRVVDEWDDTGNWTTIADFGELPDRGIEVSDLAKRLKKLNG